MADITVFPTIRQVMVSGKNLIQMTATTTVKAGMVVAIHATGVSLAVDKAIDASGSKSIGVALFDAAAGAELTLATVGCVVNVANESDSVSIDAGSIVNSSAVAVGGLVIKADITAASTVAVSQYNTIGIALAEIPVSSYGPVLICPVTSMKPNAS